MHHFDPSVIMCDSGDRCQLKIGAAPTMNLNQCAIDNESYKENKNLHRFLGFQEDLQCVCNHDMKTQDDNDADVAATVTPARESRNNKRRCEHIQAEEAK